MREQCDVCRKDTGSVPEVVIESVCFYNREFSGTNLVPLVQPPPYMVGIAVILYPGIFRTRFRPIVAVTWCVAPDRVGPMQSQVGTQRRQRPTLVDRSVDAARAEPERRPARSPVQLFS